MAQVFLHSFNIIPTHESGYRIGVPKLVEAENEGILVEVENGT